MIDDFDVDENSDETEIEKISERTQTLSDVSDDQSIHEESDLDNMNNGNSDHSPRHREKVPPVQIKGIPEMHNNANTKSFKSKSSSRPTNDSVPMIKISPSEDTEDKGISKKSNTSGKAVNIRGSTKTDASALGLSTKDLSNRVYEKEETGLMEPEGFSKRNKRSSLSSTRDTLVRANDETNDEKLSKGKNAKLSKKDSKEDKDLMKLINNKMNSGEKGSFGRDQKGKVAPYELLSQDLSIKTSFERRNGKKLFAEEDEDELTTLVKASKNIDKPKERYGTRSTRNRKEEADKLIDILMTKDVSSLEEEDDAKSESSHGRKSPGGNKKTSLGGMITRSNRKSSADEKTKKELKKGKGTKHIVDLSESEEEESKTMKGKNSQSKSVRVKKEEQIKQEDVQKREVRTRSRDDKEKTDQTKKVSVTTNKKQPINEEKKTTSTGKKGSHKISIKKEEYSSDASVDDLKWKNAFTSDEENHRSDRSDTSTPEKGYKRVKVKANSNVASKTKSTVAAGIVKTEKGAEKNSKLAKEKVKIEHEETKSNNSKSKGKLKTKIERKVKAKLSISSEDNTDKEEMDIEDDIQTSSTKGRSLKTQGKATDKNKRKNTKIGQEDDDLEDHGKVGKKVKVEDTKKPKSNKDTTNKESDKREQHHSDEAIAYHLPKRTSYRVMFSGFELNDLYLESAKEHLRDIGIKIVRDVEQNFNVLVMDKFKRTIKFLYAVSKGVSVVSFGWVKDCIREYKPLSPDDYLYKDRAMESRYKFKLSSAIEKARNRDEGLLKNYHVWMPKNIKPSHGEIRTLVESMGGTVAKIKPHYFNDDILVIVNEDDTKHIAHFKECDFNVYTTELIFSGILQQRLSFDQHRIV